MWLLGEPGFAHEAWSPKARFHLQVRFAILPEKNVYGVYDTTEEPYMGQSEDEGNPFPVLQPEHKNKIGWTQRSRILPDSRLPKPHVARKRLLTDWLWAKNINR